MSPPDRQNRCAAAGVVRESRLPYMLRRLPLFGLGGIPSQDVSEPRLYPSTPAPKPCVKTPRFFFFLLIWSFHPSGKPIWPFRLRRSLFDVVQLRPHKLHPCRNGHLGLRTVSVPGSRSPQPPASDPCPLDPPTACSGAVRVSRLLFQQGSGSRGVVELR
jgi:hypothetical protein